MTSLTLVDPITWDRTEECELVHVSVLHAMLIELRSTTLVMVPLTSRLNNSSASLLCRSLIVSAIATSFSMWVYFSSFFQISYHYIETVTIEARKEAFEPIVVFNSATSSLPVLFQKLRFFEHSSHQSEYSSYSFLSAAPSLVMLACKSDSSCISLPIGVAALVNCSVASTRTIQSMPLLHWPEERIAMPNHGK